MKKIILGLTTTSSSDYLGKIEEAKQLGITEIAFFPTAVNQEIRKDLYKRLEDSPVKSIPHVHLRDDMDVWELEYLEKKFGTQVFNIHSKNNSIRKFDLQKLKDYLPKIYVENLEKFEYIPKTEELEAVGGLCIDFSHWEEGIILNGQKYDEKMKKIIHYPVGCSHVSAFNKIMTETRDAAHPEVVFRNYSKHTFSDLSELDYVKKYVQYLPDLISLELENFFAEQLKVKEYLEKMIK